MWTNLGLDMLDLLAHLEFRGGGGFENKRATVWVQRVIVPVWIVPDTTSSSLGPRIIDSQTIGS